MRLGTRFLSFACFLALLMVGIGFAGGAASAGEAKKWAADDLQTRLVDHTIFTGAGKGDNKWRSYIYFQPDGTVLVKAWGKGWKSRIEGTWEIKSNRLCTAYEDENWGVGCQVIFDKGEKTIIIKGVSGTHKGRKFLVKILGKGNVKNLK